MEKEKWDAWKCFTMRENLDDSGYWSLQNVFDGQDAYFSVSFSFHYGIITQREDNLFNMENTHLFSIVTCCSFHLIHTETSSMSCNLSSWQN